MLLLKHKDNITFNKERDILSKKTTRKEWIQGFTKAIMNSYREHRDQLLVLSIVANIFLALSLYANVII